MTEPRVTLSSLEAAPRLALVALLASAALLFEGCSGPPEQPVAGRCEGTLDVYALLADPNLPARALPGRMRLASSRELEDPAGMGNRDERNYLRRDGDELVLMEHDGPGVLTRLWFTGRADATRDQTYLDRAVLHLYVDGRAVRLTPDRDGIELGRLVSGELDAFPPAWVADRVEASGALLVMLPIPFASSVRVSVSELQTEEASFYYQIDWRQLPAECAPESFDGTLSAEARASLERAEALWIRDEQTCATPVTRTVDLGAPADTVIEIAGPTIVRSIGVSAGDALDSLVASLEVDGVEIVETALSRLLFASPPTAPGRSALSTLAEDATATLRYPIPARERVILRLRTEAASPGAAEITICHDPVPIPADLGSLRVACGEPVSAAVGENVVLLDARARGHFAGQFLVVDGPHPNFWFLEGDHEIAVDGAYDVLGTGLEDYFGGAFYYQLGPSALPFSGASGRASSPDEGRSIVSQYRHHFLDTIPFEESLRFEYESYVEGTRFAHCSFWYEHE